jgi:hypothetical protein
MVAELDSLMEVSGQSPEAQWRTRILIRSTQDADRDIWKRLHDYETNHGENPGYSRAQMASRKLHRDFRRVHKHLQAVLASYEKRQQVEIAFLSREEEKKEDFFDRAMREREEEVGNIHRSMQKVNEIYSVSCAGCVGKGDCFLYMYVYVTNLLMWLIIGPGKLGGGPAGRD